MLKKMFIVYFWAGSVLSMQFAQNVSLNLKQVCEGIFITVIFSFKKRGEKARK